MKIQRPWLKNSLSDTSANAANPTIGHLWRYLLSPSSTSEPWQKVMEWPPDVFALCAAALRRSGAYAAAGASAGKKRCKEMMKAGEAWSKTIAADPGKILEHKGLKALPLLDREELKALLSLQEAWGNLCNKLNTEIYLIADNSSLIQDLLFLLGAADEAGRGLGLL